LLVGLEKTAPVTAAGPGPRHVLTVSARSASDLHALPDLGWTGARGSP